jgi:hypothetical protein
MAGTLGVLTIAFIANRYLADFMPLVVLAGLCGFQLTLRWLRSDRPRTHARAGQRRSVRGGIATAAIVLAVLGLWSNTALSLVYQRELRPAVPLSVRAGFVSFQQRLDARLFGGPPENVLRTSALAGNEPVGTLDIVGRCDAVYQSAGSAGGWNAVERSEAGGHFLMQVTFPSDADHAWLPVLTNGLAHQAAYLALRSPRPGEYQFGYFFQAPGQRFAIGSVFSAAPGKSYVIDAVLDSLIGEITASVDGTTQYDLGYLVRPNRPVYVGTNPLGGPVASQFPGSVRRLPVTTPICNALEARFARSP